MKRQIARSFVAVVACLLIALPTTGVAAETAPSIAASAAYDDLMAQQDAFFQTISFRTISLAAAASYDELMAQQEILFQAMSDRATALAASASYDALMAQQDAFIQQIATPDDLN